MTRQKAEPARAEAATDFEALRRVFTSQERVDRVGIVVPNR